MDSPKTFTDSAGRSWTVDVTVASSARLKPIAGVALDDFIPKVGSKEKDVGSLHEFLTDVFKIFDVFYALAKPQADALNLSKEQVQEGIADAKAEEGMVLAVLQAITDFFQRRDPPRAKMLRSAIAMLAKVFKKATDKIESIDLDKFVDAMPGLSIGNATEEAIAQLKKSAGDSPDTSASIRAH